jgi:hypothetical protein
MSKQTNYHGTTVDILQLTFSAVVTPRNKYWLYVDKDHLIKAMGIL